MTIALIEQRDRSVALSGNWTISGLGSYKFKCSPQLQFAFFTKDNQPIEANWILECKLWRDDEDKTVDYTSTKFVTHSRLDAFYKATLRPVPVELDTM